MKDPVSSDTSPRVLITAGATREPIDGVRFISNFSSGKTGCFLAEHLIQAKFQVTYLGGIGAAVPQGGCAIKTYGSYQDLEVLLKEELQTGAYQVVIHLAAVSDYSVDSIEVGGEMFVPDAALKLSSDPEELVLKLKRNPKLVSQIKSFSPQVDPLLVAFKLTQGADSLARERAVEKLFKNSEADWVVHNDLAELATGAPQYRVYQRHQKQVQGPLESLRDLAGALEKVIRGLK